MMKTALITLLVATLAMADKPPQRQLKSKSANAPSANEHGKETKSPKSSKSSKSDKSDKSNWDSETDTEEINTTDPTTVVTVEPTTAQSAAVELIGNPTSFSRIVHGDCPGYCMGISAMNTLAMIPCTLNSNVQYWNVARDGDQFKLQHAPTGLCIPHPSTCTFPGSQGNWELVDCGDGAVFMHGVDPENAPLRVISSTCFFDGEEIALASAGCTSQSLLSMDVAWSQLTDSNQQTTVQNTNFNIVDMGMFDETTSEVIETDATDGASSGSVVTSIEASTIPEVVEDEDSGEEEIITTSATATTTTTTTTTTAAAVTTTSKATPKAKTEGKSEGKSKGKSKGPSKGSTKSDESGTLTNGDLPEGFKMTLPKKTRQEYLHNTSGNRKRRQRRR